jgi:HEAT repeat protein
MDFARVLSGGDRRSIGRASVVAAFVLDHPATLGNLIGCLKSAEPVVRMRASDALEKISVKDTKNLDVHATFFLGLARDCAEQEIKWHMAQILPRLTLTDKQISEAVSIFQQYLQDPSRIVKAAALSALVALAVKKPALVRTVRALLEDTLHSSIPSARARARKLLKELP